MLLLFSGGTIQIGPALGVTIATSGGHIATAPRTQAPSIQTSGRS